MANDYTWQELFRRLGLEARPQTGYYYKPVPNPWGAPDYTYIFKNRPIMEVGDLNGKEYVERIYFKKEIAKATAHLQALSAPPPK